MFLCNPPDVILLNVNIYTLFSLVRQFLLFSDYKHTYMYIIALDIKIVKNMFVRM